MNYRCAAAALLLSTATLSAPAPGWAQGASDEATTSMARARFKEGVGYYDKGEFELARASFLQAYALKKHPAVLLNLAWSCIKSGHTLESARYFKEFLSDGKDVITDKQRADATDGLSQARAKLGQIDVAAAAGLEVTIDGDHVGTTPLSDPVMVEIGAHSVRVRAPDGTADMQTITVLGGEKASAHFRVAATPPPAPLPPAPPQQVLAPAPQASPQPPPPVVTPPPVQEPAKPSEPLPNEPPAQPHSWSPMPLWPSFVGLGLTATSVVVGVVALGAVGAAQTNANNTASQILGSGGMCPPAAPRNTQNYIDACQTYSNDNNLVTTDRTIGWASLGTGVALLTGSIVYLIVAIVHNNGEPDAVTSGRAVVTPMVGPSLSGASVAGTF
jgi:hypothetical protein